MKKINHLSEQDLLRQNAEERVQKKHEETGIRLTESESMRLLHELEVHQVELEMQNEELRTAIDRAEAATEKITMLYDFAPFGYFTLDRKGIISNLNLLGAQMLGKERCSLLKNDFGQFIDVSTRDSFREFFRKVLETGLKQTCEVWLTLQNNSSMYVQLEGIVSVSKESYLVSAVDITDHHRTEKALRENEILLQELNATKDKFFSIIAHDLRSPFSSIVGFSGLLLEQIKEEKYEGIEKYARIIQDSSWRAMNLLKNLLEWARLQTGKMRFNPEQTDMAGLIDEVTNLLDVSAKQKSITISKELPENTFVFADRDMISNVFRNLVSNAIKFTHENGHIRISVRREQEKWIVVVGDDGVGMEKEGLNYLFRIDGNKSTRGTGNEEGTGLGLLLCKEFIIKHHGKIWAESIPGKGSNFYFTIPITQP